MIYFDITPVPKPRMTQSDRWQQRPVVMRYWDYKDRLKQQAAETGFTLGDAFNVTFGLPMPVSWSKKKRARMRGRKHQQKPDLDNLVKAILDSLAPGDDARVWYHSARKVWEAEGCVIIENVPAVEAGLPMFDRPDSRAVGG